MPLAEVKLSSGIVHLRWPFSLILKLLLGVQNVLSNGLKDYVRKSLIVIDERVKLIMIGRLTFRQLLFTNGNMNRTLLLSVSSLVLALQIAECIRYSQIFSHGEKAGDSVLAKGDNVNVTANLQWSYNIFGTERNEITVSGLFRTVASYLK